jgi:hypothetical protein
LPRRKQRSKKVPHAKKQNDVSLHTQRVTQYTALQLLRAIKYSAVDDSSVIHALSYNDLDSEQFVDIDDIAYKLLTRITRALQAVKLQHAVSAKSMQVALTAEQHAFYLDSFKVYMSPEEDAKGDLMPTLLRDYAEQIKLGDKYAGLASRQRGRNVQRRDAQGRTAAQRSSYKSEAMYERAIALLISALDYDKSRNPNFNAALAGDVAMWLDRNVSCEPGEQPALDIESVPRIRGSRSQHCLVAAEKMWGPRLRRYWRQREALVNAALQLLYKQNPIERAMQVARNSQHLQKKLQAINSEKD